jgi:hypothetical protein
MFHWPVVYALVESEGVNTGNLFFHFPIGRNCIAKATLHRRVALRFPPIFAAQGGGSVAGVFSCSERGGGGKFQMMWWAT